MKLFLFFLLLISCASALNKIVIKGNKFFDSVTGLQFFVKGISYQPSYDPILDIENLKGDIALLKAIDVNLIRCYQADWTQNHDEGMALLAEAGIYVMFDLGDPKLSIQYSGPWSTIVFENYRRKIDAFASYSNTFAYLAGNEVVFKEGESISASFVKAAVRDTKAYIKARGYNIPIGYAGADVPAQPKMMDYMNCGSVEDSVDFYGLNSYSWCGESNMQASSFDKLLQYSSYSVPFLFTEYGCNTAGFPRPFTEILSIYGPDLENVLSGAIVFEFHQEWNLFGLVNITATGERVLLPDYYSYQTQIKKVNPTQIKMSDYTKTYPLQSCPAVTEPDNYASAYNWLAAASPLPPTPNNDQCKCMYAQSKCRTDKESLDFTVETRPHRDAIENYKASICPGTNCYPVGVAPQYAVYGEWSMCNPYEQLTFAMNVYYEQGHGCNHTTIPGSLGQSDAYAGVNCSSLPLNYDSYSLDYPAADPITGVPITNPGNNCAGGLQKCGDTCYNPKSFCCNGNTLTAGDCSGSIKTNPVTSPSTNSPATGNGQVTESKTPTSTANPATGGDSDVSPTTTIERAQNGAVSVVFSLILALICVLISL